MDTPIHEQYLCIQSRYIKVVWSHKIQEKQAEIYLKTSNNIQKAKTILSVLTTGGVISPILPILDDLLNYAQPLYQVIVALLAAILLYLTLRYPDGVLETKALENKKHAAKVHNLRNRYESLMYDIKTNCLSIDRIIETRNALERIENELYAEPAPHTSQKAVNKATQALKESKDSTTEIQEIIQIVPPELQEFPQSTE